MRKILFPFFGFLTIFSAHAQDADSVKRSFAVYPIIFYTRETRLGGGAAGAWYWRRMDHSEKPANLTTQTIYTQEKQFVLSFFGDRYWKKNLYHGNGFLLFQKYPTTFYGIGNNTKLDQSERYTPLSTSGNFHFEKQFFPDAYFGGQFQWNQTKIIDRLTGGILDSARITGWDRGVAIGVGFTATLDSRDDVQFPRYGHFVYGSAIPFFGYRFNRLIMDARTYHSFFRKDALALQFYGSFMSGKPPFYMLSSLGGAYLMRGYYYGRYSDRQMVITQAEYRFPIWRFIGAGIFGGFGDVAHDINGFRISQIKYSYGGGLRANISEDAIWNFRLDFGWGRNSSAFYIAIGEAF